MKKKVLRYVLFVFCVICGSILFAQEKTLLDGDIEHGGFGAPVIKLTGIDGSFQVLTGARGGWIINHSYVLGVGTYSTPDELNLSGDSYDFSYSGFEFEYIYHPDALFHVSGTILIGGGTLHQSHNTDNPRVTDGLFVLEPTLNGLVNITKHIHLSAGIGYRLVSGVDLEPYSNSDFSNVSGTLAIQFGKF